MGLTAKMSLKPEFHKRQAERMPVDIDASMRELGTEWGDAHIHNLSTHGFMAESDHIFSVGAYVWLRLPGVGSLNAQIRWRDCFRYGCEFVTPLEPAQCQAAIALGEQSAF